MVQALKQALNKLKAGLRFCRLAEKTPCPGGQEILPWQVENLHVPNAQDITAMYLKNTIMARYLRDTAAGMRGLNLGCGGMTFKGWLNVDADQPHHVDILWDLRNKLPFIPDGTFDAVYSEHFWEHIDRKSSLALARDSFRVLRNGGQIRIAVPDLDLAIGVYNEHQKYPREFYAPFADFYGELFYTRGEQLDVAMRAWGHTYLYNVEDMSLLLQAAGFINVRRMELNQSETPFLANRESRPAEQSSLIVEATKP